MSSNDLSFQEFAHYWFKYVENPTLKVPDIHEKIITFLSSYDNWKDDTAILEMFRGAGKSTLVGLFIVWRLVLDPSLNFLILSAESKLAKKMLRDCKNIITKHPLATFLKPKGRDANWSSTEITVRGATSGRDFSIGCFGLGGQYTGARCNFLIFDDVEVKSTANTPELHETMKDRIAEAGNTVTPKGKTLFIGTPWATDTIYEEKIAEGYTFIKLPLLTNMKGTFPEYTGTSAWPERFDDQFIKQKQKEGRKNSAFLSQYQLIPEQDSECIFDVNRIKEYSEDIEMITSQGRPIHKLCGKQLASVTAFWDPATSKAKRDDSVLAIVFTTTEGEYFIHRAFALKGEIKAQCEQVKKIALEFHLPSITVESNGVGAFAWQILKEHVRDIGVAVVNKPTTMNKMEKISGTFEIPLSAGLLHAHKSVMDSKFKIQLRRFTGSVKGRDDYIDAVSMAILDQPVRLSKMKNFGSGFISNWREGVQATEYKVDNFSW